MSSALLPVCCLLASLVFPLSYLLGLLLTSSTHCLVPGAGLYLGCHGNLAPECEIVALLFYYPPTVSVGSVGFNCNQALDMYRMQMPLQSSDRLGYLQGGGNRTVYRSNLHTPNANMADHSVGTWDELHESEASEASVFCFDNASCEKSCFVDGPVCFISLCLRVFEFLNASRSE